MFTDEERGWLDDHFEDLRREVVNLRIEVEKLKVKASLWGALGGMVTVAVTLCCGILMYLFRSV